MQSDSHCNAARQAGEEEPPRVGDINNGPDHNHAAPKETQPTFDWNSVDSNTRMYFHRSSFLARSALECGSAACGAAAFFSTGARRQVALPHSKALRAAGTTSSDSVIIDTARPSQVPE
jgi:hypothetical protein